MSAPIREPGDDGLSKDGPLNYAPRRARRLERHPDSNGAPGKGAAANAPRKHDAVDASRKSAAVDASRKGDAAAALEKSASADAPRKGDAASAPRKNDALLQRGTSEPPVPPWKRKKQPQAFAGDVATAELRTRVPLAPDRLPEPPLPVSTFPKFASAGRIVGVVMVATVGVVGYRWSSAPSTTSSQRQVTLTSNQADLAHARGVATPAQPTSASSADPASRRAASRQVAVDAIGLQQVDEPARLTISAADAGAKVAVVIGGLAPGSALSAGTQAGPTTWRLSTADFNNAVITPPRGFVGTMDLTLELRLADNTVVDRKGLQLEWSDRSVAKSQPRQLEATDIALMRKNGAEFMANGNIVAARMMFQPAAEAGDPAAAFALAETYDPLVLRKLGAKGGGTADVALAHSWYEKAKDLGSTTAPERLERLARLPE